MWQALLVMTAMALPPAAARSGADDAAARLAQAMRTGTFDAADAAAIVGWVLRARDEEVAEGFRHALRSADPGVGAEGGRWDATAQAMVRLFERALADAASHRRSGGDDWNEVADLLKAAAPAVAAALGDTRARAPARAGQR